MLLTMNYSSRSGFPLYNLTIPRRQDIPYFQITYEILIGQSKINISTKISTKRICFRVWNLIDLVPRRWFDRYINLKYILNHLYILSKSRNYRFNQTRNRCIHVHHIMMPNKCKTSVDWLSITSSTSCLFRHIAEARNIVMTTVTLVHKYGNSN